MQHPSVNAFELFNAMAFLAEHGVENLEEMEELEIITIANKWKELAARAPT